MKMIFVLIGCLLVISCNDNPGDKFVGKWTDGHLRHIAIETTAGGYIVDDISMGHKKYFAKLLNDELVVTTQTGVSLFNYIKSTDELFAGQVDFHRETDKN
jgi:hypothetical protein